MYFFIVYYKLEKFAIYESFNPIPLNILRIRAKGKGKWQGGANLEATQGE